MKTLFLNDEKYGWEAEQIVIADDSIVGKTQGTEVFAFHGVKFENITYRIEDEEGNIVGPDIAVDENEQRITDLELAMASILGGGA